MIIDQQQKQIEQWICSPQYKQIESQIVDGCVEILQCEPRLNCKGAFIEVCCDIITSKQTNFMICRSIWQYVWTAICQKYGEDYYPKMIQNRQKELSINEDF